MGRHSVEFVILYFLGFMLLVLAVSLGSTNIKTFVLFIFSAKSAQAEVKVDQVYRQTNFESFFHGS